MTLETAKTAKELIRNPLLKFLITESTIVSVITLNAVVLFLHAFPSIPEEMSRWLLWIDYLCLSYFVFEAIIKIRFLGFAKYWEIVWNKFDLIIAIAGLPQLLLSPFYNIEHIQVLSILPILRLGRFLRMLRVIQFIPDAEHVSKGVIRALKASVGVFLILIGLNFILAMGANELFGDLAPEYFGNPLISLYTLFKVFTIEGWYEIPDIIAERAHSDLWSGVVRAYFIFSVFVGGILGLSLANAVFVDEMMVDNNDELEEMITNLQAELGEFRQEVTQGQNAQLLLFQTKLEEIQQQIHQVQSTASTNLNDNIQPNDNGKL